MRPPVIDIEIICENEGNIPIYASEGAAGADVRANIQGDIVISPGERVLIPTGIRAAIPEGYEIQVRPRSGLAYKNMITILNAPGTVDSDYRGEICVNLINHGKEDFVVQPGMRIAQLVVAPVMQARYIVQDELTLTKRGDGGFGHTGVL